MKMALAVFGVVNTVISPLPTPPAVAALLVIVPVTAAEPPDVVIAISCS
jgi:hypothetical protein